MASSPSRFLLAFGLRVRFPFLCSVLVPVGLAAVRADGWSSGEWLTLTVVVMAVASMADVPVLGAVLAIWMSSKAP